MFNIFKNLSTIFSQTIYLIFILLTVAINPVQAEMSSLGVLTGGSFSYAQDVSSDGSVMWVTQIQQMAGEHLNMLMAR